MQASESIRHFLDSVVINYADDLTSQYDFNMEVQLYVDASKGHAAFDGLKRIPNVWEVSNHPEFGTFTFSHVRIPHNANGKMGEPSHTNGPLRYPLAEVIASVGMTGWDWQNKVSRWVGFDFDAITGHAKGVGVDASTLDMVRSAAKEIPWVQVRRSTGGAGLHLYVFFDPDNLPTTTTHTEHAAVARAVLGMMSREINDFDFAAHVDVCGGNMWVWSSRITTQNRGLERLKQFEDYCPELPMNWRDNVDVVSGKRSRVKVQGFRDEYWEYFESRAQAFNRVTLDDTHKTIESRIAAMGYSIIWQPDYHCWHTHTKAFEDLIQDHDEYVGVFKTVSEGNDKGSPNCFAFPLPFGGMRITRFQSPNERKGWKHDSNGWAWTFFNRRPDLETAATYHDGIPDPDKGGWVFTHHEDLVKTCQTLGEELDTDCFTKLGTEGRQYFIRNDKHGGIVIEISKKRGDTVPTGWIEKPKVFLRRLNVVEETDPDPQTYDEVVRALVSPNNTFQCWLARDKNGIWIETNKDNVRSVFKALDIGDAENQFGKMFLDPWRLVNVPFQPEYLGDRRWNKNAAQLRFQPGEPGSHPSWDMVLDHCGKGLNDAVFKNKWCKDHNIRDGREYLLLWISCLFRHPFDQLPYLFLYGPQNSGKSIFHEALAMLMTSGVIYADEALRSRSGFNGELANAILCVVEEVDISGSKEIYNRLKSWVTGLQLRIRPLYQEVYMAPNTTHWVQCANSLADAPIFPGDTRITMSYVPPVAKEIPKAELKDLLVKEAGAFIRTLFDMRVPPPPGRLRVPVLDTDDKSEAELVQRSDVEVFIDDFCFAKPGHSIVFSEFFDAFQNTLKPSNRNKWSRHAVSTVIREATPFPIGRHTDNKLTIGNISFSVDAEPDFDKTLVQHGQKLRYQK